MAISAGDNLGPYKIVSRIGAGGMGEVFRAWDTRLERDVAIKVFRPGLFIDKEMRNRFRKEALALARLNHANIAAIYDVGEHNGVDYIVMEYIAGQPLSEKLLAGPLPLQQALAVGVEVAAALEEAHEQGVVHRDLKPSNIAVTAKGHAKVLDFGLAKLLSPSTDLEATMSAPETQGLIGTLLYMSPEQAEGGKVDSRTDLWGLGVILYESLSGEKPFHGQNTLTILRSITKEKPKHLPKFHTHASPEIEHIVSRALQKDADHRYQTATEMHRDLTQAIGHVSGIARQQASAKERAFRKYAVAAIFMALVLTVVIGGLYWRSEKRSWARETAIPEVERLKDENRWLAAFLLLKNALPYLPADDPQLKQLTSDLTETSTIHSSPSGASVEIQDYLTPSGQWYSLGATPLNAIQIPKGYFRWKVSKPGVGESVTAPETGKEMTFALDKQRSAPSGMVAVPEGNWEDYIAEIGWVGPYHLPAFYMDRYEVTNRDFQKFIDDGGYEKPEYWKEKFIQNGREINWQQAMALFRDSTGRHGPSTWKAGHFPEGEGDYPVSGVSWYEASAYAAYAGKSLPAIFQWYNTTSADVAHYATQMSNIAHDKLAPVGSFHDVGVYGTYDLAGNVREWTLNAVGGNRFILGGAWNAPNYLYLEPEALPPMDRSAENGFRCAQNIEPLPAVTMQPVKAMERDFAKATPVSDEVFRAYKAMYSYSKTPLNATVAEVVEETADWKKEKITFNAAYNGERMTAYLFLPKNVRPPYQTILFFPSARVLSISNSADLSDIKFFDYIVQSGRAVMYPIYKETYERTTVGAFPWTLEVATEQFKDLSRSVDYLETRSDIDTKKLAYVGVSMGSAEGVDYATLLQDKLRTVIFLDGGFFLNAFPPGVDPVNYAPRLKIPVLMVNGRYDFTFPLEQAQNPLFKMIGTPESEKKHVVMQSPHDVTVQHAELVKETLNWLDKYLGPVQ